MKSTSYPIPTLVALGVAALVTGCAITPQEVTAIHAEKTTTIETAKVQAAGRQAAASAVYTVIKGNYLGGNLIATSTGTGLPQRYRDVEHVAPTKLGTLQMAVNNVQNFGLNVKLNPDVAAAGASTATSQQKPPVLVPLNIKGDMTDYLNQITNQLGVSWNYNPTFNEVHIFRMTSKSCSVDDVPGSIGFTDTMNSSGSGSTGDSDGGGSSGGASFGSSTSANVTASSYNFWDSLLETVKDQLTPGGKLSANKATGTLYINDTKDAAERACAVVAHENARMNLQVAIDVREITVQLNDGGSLAVDLNMVFQQLNTITGAPDWVFKYNSPSNLSDGGSGSAGFNIARPSSRLAGSSIAADALSSFGKVVSDKTDTILTRNRIPGRLQDVVGQAYVKSTTPGAGSVGVGGGAGVPGLTPGMVTYGSTITFVPTIGDNNNVTMHLFNNQSNLLSLDSSTPTGSGATAQQITIPSLSTRKFAQSFTVQHGETIILVSSDSDAVSSKTNASFSGASNKSQRIRRMSLLMVTPRVMIGG